MIILPYLGLMILVMLVGSGIAITLVADNWQERFNNQLGQVARNFTESFAQREIGNITFLSQIVFTAANPDDNAPSIVDAMRNRDTDGLNIALKGLWVHGQNNENVDQDRLIVFDTKGIAFADWARNDKDSNDPIRYADTDLSGQPLVQAVLSGREELIPGINVLGDKYSGLIAFRSDTGEDVLHFFTVAPVYFRNNDDEKGQLVGGLLVAERLDSLLPTIQNKSQAAISTIYDVDGVVLATTITGGEDIDLKLRKDLINQVESLNEPAALSHAREAIEPCLDIGKLTG
ncbi:MAG: PAS domain-containing sensor histidine kinase, partial [Oscillochloris sp.]|nr:PAS domain-containing sensor histidine kinase [Oscillochloris sp.]